MAGITSDAISLANGQLRIIIKVTIALNVPHEIFDRRSNNVEVVQNGVNIGLNVHGCNGETVEVVASFDAINAVEVDRRPEPTVRKEKGERRMIPTWFPFEYTVPCYGWLSWPEAPRVER